MRMFKSAFSKRWKMTDFPQAAPTLIRTERCFSATSQTLSDVPSELIIKSAIKYGSRWSACRGLVTEYSKNTSIHGLRFIFEIHRPLYEKIMWLILVLISLYIAVALIWDTYLKWFNSPVILVIDEAFVPVHKIPFPTVTICPEIKMEIESFDFTTVSQQIWTEIEKLGTFNNLGNLTDDDLMHFMATLHICENEVLDKFSPYMTENLPVDVTQTLVHLALPINSTLLSCKWNGQFYLPFSVFRYVLTEEGICYQFNGLETKDIYRDPKYLNYHHNISKPDFNSNLLFEKLPAFNNPTGNWSLDYGYIGQGLNAYPQRSVLSSARNGLSVAMTGLKNNFEYACRSFIQGYKVFINSPESVPSTTDNYILVPHGNEVLVSLLPQYIRSEEDLHEYDPQKRHCYFNDERYLRYFKAYSQSNCQAECLTNFTINKCGCAKFWMPKPRNVPVCGLADAKCFSTAADEMIILISNQTKQQAIDAKAKILCDCLPSCNALDYDFEISRAFFDFEKTVKAFRENDYTTESLGVRLSIYYKERQFTATKRTAVYSLTTLIANCGGILGLLMGVSIISIIELMYFFSIRLVKHLHRRRAIKRILIKALETET